MPLLVYAQIGATLDDLDQFGSLESLALSLDDAYWAETELNVIQGETLSPSGARVSGRAVRALALVLRSGMGLEELDQFGNLDNLPFTLDDPFWSGTKIYIVGGSISPGSARASARKVFFPKPLRSVSPSWTRIRESWTIGPDRLRSVSPSGARFGFDLLFPLLLRSLSPGTTVARAFMWISPPGMPMQSFSPNDTIARAHFRGHGWITRAV
jgi:hypothetical protein